MGTQPIQVEILRETERLRLLIFELSSAQHRIRIGAPKPGDIANLPKLLKQAEDLASTLQNANALVAKDQAALEAARRQKCVIRYARGVGFMFLIGGIVLIAQMGPDEPPFEGAKFLRATNNKNDVSEEWRLPDGTLIVVKRKAEGEKIESIRIGSLLD